MHDFNHAGPVENSGINRQFAGNCHPIGSDWMRVHVYCEFVDTVMKVFMFAKGGSGTRNTEISVVVAVAPS